MRGRAAHRRNQVEAQQWEGGRKRARPQEIEEPQGQGTSRTLTRLVKDLLSGLPSLAVVP